MICENSLRLICYTSIDHAKTSVESANLETLEACIENLDTRGDTRKTLRRMIEQKIKRLRKTRDEIKPVEKS